MDMNVGVIDRWIRYAAGAVLMVAGLRYSGLVRWLAWSGALIMVATATMRLCPIWLVLKVNTFTKALGMRKT